MAFGYRLCWVAWLSFLAASAWAGVPVCMDRGVPLSVNNDQVIQWKQSEPNQWLARAHVQGTLTTQFPDHNGHVHFEAQIGPNPTDTIEIIYNVDFGALPPLHAGMQVEACGDFIVSIAQTGPYPASPDGAILHWVHENPRPYGHESGYVAFDGVAYGQNQPTSGAQGHGHKHGRFEVSGDWPSDPQSDLGQ